MGKKSRRDGVTTVEVTVDTREKLRLVRDAYGLRSHNEAILKLISISDDKVLAKIRKSLKPKKSTSKS